MNLIRVLTLTLALVSCVSVPKIEGDMQAQLEHLEAAKKPMKEVKNPWVAAGLSIFPGAGQMYCGDFGDGALTLLTFWLVVPYYMGFVDAIQEARVANAKYTIAYYKRAGFRFSLFERSPPERYRLLTPGQLVTRVDRR